MGTETELPEALILSIFFKSKIQHLIHITEPKLAGTGRKCARWKKLFKSGEIITIKDIGIFNQGFVDSLVVSPVAQNLVPGSGMLKVWGSILGASNFWVREWV